MISQETKDAIEKAGKKEARVMYPGSDRLNHGRIAFTEGYSEGAYEYAEKLEEKDKELAQLKEIAEKMKEALEAQPDMYSLTIDVKNKALTAYAEWCKQNLK